MPKAKPSDKPSVKPIVLGAVIGGFFFGPLGILAGGIVGNMTRK